MNREDLLWFEVYEKLLEKDNKRKKNPCEKDHQLILDDTSVLLFEIYMSSLLLVANGF